MTLHYLIPRHYRYDKDWEDVFAYLPVYTIQMAGSGGVELKEGVSVSSTTESSQTLSSMNMNYPIPPTLVESPCDDWSREDLRALFLRTK